MTRRVASLGMYDSASVQAANDALWTAIASRLRTDGMKHVPDELDRSRPLEEIWSDPDLLLAQTCGYPLMTAYRGRLRYVATPRYRAAGCDEASHRSRIIVRHDDESATLRDYRDRTAAVNDDASNTGMNLFRAAVAPHAIDGVFFGAILKTGSHAASARQIADGRADIAAIDAVTFAHLDSEQPKLTRSLRTLGWTDAAPGLPFVTSILSSDQLVQRLRDVIAAAIADQTTAAEALFLESAASIGVGRYSSVMSLERQAIAAGYPRLN